ncbi:hypothetical protein ABH15_07085 [Methanoculleus taiwanensis]|uniref:Pyrrolo-quinoline quinone repeat domain-containing protein n=2 Tax=Methanoculleus taiwanensis TaxID=1550565 RepID=A0A498GZL0_9EURY|nr:hypothetical protein ABH15_07085 [Methanoculleus taiwanensis]
MIRRSRPGLIACGLLVLAVLLCGTASAEEEAYGLLWKAEMTAPVSGMGISLDGSTIAVGAGSTLYLFDKNGHELWSEPIGGQIQGVGLSPEGSHIGVAADKLYLFDREGNLLWTEKTNNFPYHDVALSSNASNIAGACDDGTIYVFDSEQEVLWDASLGADCYGIAISNDGRFIAAGCGDQGVYLLLNGEGTLWSYGTGKAVASIGMSPTGGYIVAGSLDRCVYLSTRGGDHLWKYPATKPIHGVAVASNQGGVAAGSGDTVYLFKNDGELAWKYRVGSSIEDLEISADGAVVAVGTGMGGNSLYLFTNDRALLGENTTGDQEGEGALEDVVPVNSTSDTGDENVSVSANASGTTGAAGSMLAWIDNLLAILFNRAPGEF